MEQFGGEIGLSWREIGLNCAGMGRSGVEVCAGLGRPGTKKGKTAGRERTQFS